MTRVMAVQVDGFRCLGVNKDEKFYWVCSDGRWVQTWQQAIASAVSTGLFAQVLDGNQLLFGRNHYVREYDDSYRQKP
jgi:hypothetical protein